MLASGRGRWAVDTVQSLSKIFYFEHAWKHIYEATPSMWNQCQQEGFDWWEIGRDFAVQQMTEHYKTEVIKKFTTDKRLRFGFLTL